MRNNYGPSWELFRVPTRDATNGYGDWTDTAYFVYYLDT